VIFFFIVANVHSLRERKDSLRFPWQEVRLRMLLVILKNRNLLLLYFVIYIFILLEWKQAAWF